MAIDKGNLHDLGSTEATVSHNDFGDLSNLLAGADVGPGAVRPANSNCSCAISSIAICAAMGPSDVTSRDASARSYYGLAQASAHVERADRNHGCTLDQPALKRGEAYSFEYTSPNSRQLLIRRRRLTQWFRRRNRARARCRHAGPSRSQRPVLADCERGARTDDARA